MTLGNPVQVKIKTLEDTGELPVQNDEAPTSKTSADEFTSRLMVLNLLDQIM